MRLFYIKVNGVGDWFSLLHNGAEGARGYEVLREPDHATAHGLPVFPAIGQKYRSGGNLYEVLSEG